MRDYSKVGPRFWIGKTGKKLRAAGAAAQLVGLYLMTSPHANMTGLYYVSRDSIAHETGLGSDEAAKGLESCIEAGFCSYDDESEMVWVHEMAFYQIAEKLSAADKRSAGVQNEYNALPDNPFLGAFFDKYSGPFNMKCNREPADDGFCEASCKPPPSQEQEQAQEHEQEQALAAYASAALPPAAMSSAVQLSIAMRSNGVASQPADPRLIALAAQGVTPETVVAACQEARRAKPDGRINLGYVTKILERWTADAAKVGIAGGAAPRQSGAAPGLSDKFVFSHLDRSGDQRAMRNSMARHGITVPGPNEEIEI